MNSPPSDSLANDLTDKTVGDYRIIRRLGRGGMADVYLAEQLSLKRNVAFKVLKAELAKDSSYVARFHREAQAAAGLVQANIVQIYEVGNAEGIHFIAQEYVPGRNLRQYLSRHGAVEPLMALNVIRQVSLALQKADESSVVHRDIKPENIMLSTSGEVKVTDFGLARINRDQDVSEGLTQIGITMGTPLYMSPEQVEGLKLDSRSDIYSLGVTAYHMLAGQPPFEGENAIAIAVKQVNDAATPLADIRPDSPESLNTLIHRMMSKRPDDRPANASLLLKEIRKVRISEDENWELLVDKLSSREIHESTHPTELQNAKNAVTRQLQNVMWGHVESWWLSRRTLSLFAGLLLGGLILGILAAIYNPPVNLLEGVESRAMVESVPRQANVVQQYRTAYWGTGDTEKYWQAVLEYFPIEDASATDRAETEYYHQLANERLGELYLQGREFERAFVIYEKFANTEDISPRINVVGWAGKAIIHDSRQEERDLVRLALSKVEQKLELLSDFLKTKVTSLLRKYRQPSVS